MYQTYDYDLYKHNLREAEKRREQHELIRNAQDRAGDQRDDQQKGLPARLMRRFKPGTQPKQEAAGVRCVPA